MTLINKRLFLWNYLIADCELFVNKNVDEEYFKIKTTCTYILIKRFSWNIDRSIAKFLIIQSVASFRSGLTSPRSARLNSMASDGASQRSEVLEHELETEQLDTDQNDEASRQVDQQLLLKVRQLVDEKEQLQQQVVALMQQLDKVPFK